MVCYVLVFVCKFLILFFLQFIDEELEKFNIRRMDCFLSDFVVFLVEDNILLKRFDLSLVVLKEGLLNGVVFYKGKGLKGVESFFVLLKDDSVNYIKEDIEEVC